MFGTYIDHDVEVCASLLEGELPALKDPELREQLVKGYVDIMLNFGFSHQEIANTFITRDTRMMLLAYFASIGMEAEALPRDGTEESGDQSTGRSRSIFGDFRQLHLDELKLKIPSIVEATWRKKNPD